MSAVRRLVNELRKRGYVVHEWSGWDGRGNEGVSQIDPKGAVIHHTATPVGSAFAGLVSSTRPGMIGAALCNFAGNADGSFTVIASGIAWHAGQGAGPSLGPLAPYRHRMNYYTVGLEIVYPGNSPMTEAQYRSALGFSKAVADLFGGGNIEVVRAHAETNGRGGDGKWDPGYAPGKTIDMGQFRRLAAQTKYNDGEDDDDMNPDEYLTKVEWRPYEGRTGVRNRIDMQIERTERAISADERLAAIDAKLGKLIELLTPVTTQEDK